MFTTPKFSRLVLAAALIGVFAFGLFRHGEATPRLGPPVNNCCLCTPVGDPPVWSCPCTLPEGATSCIITQASCTNVLPWCPN